jgi:hypothetical protein
MEYKENNKFVQRNEKFDFLYKSWLEIFSYYLMIPLHMKNERKIFNMKILWLFSQLYKKVPFIDISKIIKYLNKRKCFGIGY